MKALPVSKENSKQNAKNIFRNNRAALMASEVVSKLGRDLSTEFAQIVQEHISVRIDLRVVIAVRSLPMCIARWFEGCLTTLVLKCPIQGNDNKLGVIIWICLGSLAFVYVSLRVVERQVGR